MPVVTPSSVVAPTRIVAPTPAVKPTRRLVLLAAAVLAAGLGLPLGGGCGKVEDPEANKPKPWEGKYKNAKGEVVVELKEGRILFKDPSTKAQSEISMTPAGENKMMVESGAGMFTMTFTPPDTLAGVPAKIAGDAGPLKKVP